MSERASLPHRLSVVSTKVGGVPEVLPPSMIKFAEPNPTDLVEGLSEAISISRRVVPVEMHERIKHMYSWLDVAERTENVYNSVVFNIKKPSLATRLIRYSTSGTFSGIAACVFVTLLHFLWKCCEFLWPRTDIEICPDVVVPGNIRRTVSKSR